MAGRIDISSGVEDLSSVSVDELKSSLEGNDSDEAYLSLFNSVKSEKNQIEASVEALEGLDPKSKVTAGENGACECEKRPPLVSKVIDANGSAYISILYDGHPYTGGGEMGVITGLLDSASEKDVVDITIATALQNFNQPTTNVFKTLSLLSSIRNCKAKVITRIGCFASFDDCAIWLSGTDRRVSPMAWLAVRQPRFAMTGTTLDAEFRVEDVKIQIKTMTDFIVEKGLLTQEEVDKICNEQAMVGMSYDALFERIKSLKK